MPKAYPVYDERYQHNVDVIRAWLAASVPNVHPVGRNGMHRYNNQDHSMLTAMLTAENIVHGTDHDVWAVNVEQDYHERSRLRPPTGGGAPAGTRRSCRPARSRTGGSGRSARPPRRRRCADHEPHDDACPTAAADDGAVRAGT